jgi:putative sigma-54 modulation protein
MNIKITGNHVDTGENLKNFIEEKMLRVERHLQQIQQVHFMLHPVDRHNQFRAEATVNVKGGQLIAESTGESMYAAIDTLIDKLDRQAIKHKDKWKGHRENES